MKTKLLLIGIISMAVGGVATLAGSSKVDGIIDLIRTDAADASSLSAADYDGQSFTCRYYDVEYADGAPGVVEFNSEQMTWSFEANGPNITDNFERSFTETADGLLTDSWNRTIVGVMNRDGRVAKAGSLIAETSVTKKAAAKQWDDRSGKELEKMNFFGRSVMDGSHPYAVMYNVCNPVTYGPGQ